MNTWWIHIEGQVQSVGFRLYVYLLAKSMGLRGWVRNGSDGVFSDGIHLWIADTVNRRNLYFDKIPSQNFTAADHVIGKRNFEDRDYENNDPVWPYSVKVNQQVYCPSPTLNTTGYFFGLIGEGLFLRKRM